MTRIRLVLFSALVFAGGGAAAATFSEDFSIYPKGRCFGEGSSFGPWSVLFTGFGCVTIEREAGRAYLRADTALSRKPAQTHAVLVAGPRFTVPLSFEARVRTLRQLRRRSRPNPWEVGWLVWAYQDNDHFYYFVPRTNGWELGKRDPSYVSGQRSLASGGEPAFPLAAWTRLRVEQDQGAITVYADGRRIVSMLDAERPYVSGRIGFYEEDARSCFGDIAVRGEPSVESPPLAPL